jgi:hypothetical protein
MFYNISLLLVWFNTWISKAQGKAGRQQINVKNNILYDHQWETPVRLDDKAVKTRQNRQR